MAMQVAYGIEAPDFGQAERHRLQAQTLIALLWSHSKTQDVSAKLIMATALDRPMRHLRSVVRREGSINNIKSADLALFEAILAKRKTIGNTICAHVQSLLGKYVPWVAAQLVAHFTTQVQASACRGQLVYRSTVKASISRALEIPMPVGATLREMRASLRRSAKAKLHDLMTYRGRAPRKKVGSLARDAAWYYLYVVEGRSIHSLAKQYMAERRPNNQGSYDARCLVLTKIRETAKRLGLPIKSK